MSAENPVPQDAPRGPYIFGLATVADEPALRRMALTAPNHGTMRLGFDRSPDYFASLAPEGKSTEVIICRNAGTHGLVAAGHRSFRTLMVNGKPTPVGYLGGLRLDPEARGGLVLARGYHFLRQRHEDARVRFYLTTIMEDNRAALDLLRSGRCGLPQYQDLGRYCCMALAPHTRNSQIPSGVEIREARPEDLGALLSFLEIEAPGRQFFPVYDRGDLSGAEGLLPGLHWRDILLAWKGTELIGITAGWNQLSFRRWHVSGYAPWLRLLRHPLNLVARLRGLPPLPEAGSRPDYRILALPCIRNSDTHVFAALLDRLLVRCHEQKAFLLAGLHEQDPLVNVLLKRPHVAMHSRLFAVAWEDGLAELRGLRKDLAPYLELGSL